MRIGQQHEGGEETLRSFREKPRLRRTLGRLFGVRAVPGLIPRHRPLDDDRKRVDGAHDGREGRVLHAGDVVDVNRPARSRRQGLGDLDRRRAAALQERDGDGRVRALRIGEQDVGREERSGGAFGEVAQHVVADHRQHDVVAGAAGIGDRERDVS